MTVNPEVVSRLRDAARKTTNRLMLRGMADAYEVAADTLRGLAAEHKEDSAAAAALREAESLFRQMAEDCLGDLA